MTKRFTRKTIEELNSKTRSWPFLFCWEIS